MKIAEIRKFIRRKKFNCLNKVYLHHPKRSAPPKSSSSSTGLGSSFLVYFLAYYFLAGTGAVFPVLGADPLDDTFFDPALIN